MALVIADRVKVTTTTTGTGDISLAGASTGFQDFSAVGDGNTTYYAVSSALGSEYEVGIGTYTASGPSLSRDTILASSNSGSAVNFSAGTKDVYVVAPADRSVVVDGSSVSIPNSATVPVASGGTGASTASAALANLGLTATAAELNLLDGVTATTTELNYVDGVTSSIQTQLDAMVEKAGDTMTGFLTLSADPTSALHAATKEYVDTVAAAGIHYHTAVRVEAPSNLNATYNNGTSGVGATLTNAGTLAAISIDGVALSSADRVLVYNQTNAAHNGIYTVTTVGDGATAWVLTRATDADSYGVSDPNALGEGDAFFVSEGDTGAGELYVMNTSGTITFGTTNITFSVIAETAVYSAGTGLDLTGTVFSHTDTSSQSSVNNSGNTFIQDVTVDGFGHVTGLTSVAVTTASANTASTIVARDASGNFSAGTITAALSGNASTATKLATSRTLQLSGDATGSASFDGSANANISVSLAADSVAASEIAANAVGASELNVTGNGTTSQFLRSDGDGTFTWATPTDTNTTYTAGTGLTLTTTTFSVNYGSTSTTACVGNDSRLSDSRQCNNSFDNASSARTNLGLGSLATLSSVDASTITDNSVGAAELNVTGNGTTAQFLRSDGDGTFTWATPTDTNTTYSAGTAMDLSGTTFNLDLSELSTSTTDGDGDFFVVVDTLNAQRKLTKGNINISGFNNDAGYTANIGDITSVTAGTGLTGGGGSGAVTLNVGAGAGITVNADDVALSTAGPGAGTYGSTANGTKIDTITLDAYGRVTAVATGATGSSSTTGTVTSVATGTGLTGGTITSTGTISLSHLGIESLTDPNADRIMFWDDSAGAMAWLSAGTNVTISGTTISATDTNTTYSAGSGLSLSGTTFSLLSDHRSGLSTTDVYDGNNHDYTFYDADVGIRWYTTGSEEMRLTDAGTLHVGGDVVAYSTTVSDERLKEDIETVTGALDMVCSMRGVTFKYKKDGKLSAGVVAQEIEQVFPRAVSETQLPLKADDDQEYKVVQYDQLHAVLIEAVKELSDKVKELEAKVG